MRWKVVQVIPARHTEMSDLTPNSPLMQDIQVLMTNAYAYQVGRLSRAPDASAVDLLPLGSSVSSLRERAQLALRASAAAGEASQRASAYSAAASAASAKAAEAAETAASAAAAAQVGCTGLATYKRSLQ